MFKNNKSIIIALIICIVAVALFFIYSSKKPEQPSVEKIVSIEQLTGRNVAILQSSNYEDNVRSKVNGIKLMHFNSEPDELQALKSGKVDAIVMDLPIANEMISTGVKLRVLPEVFAAESCSFLIANNNKDNLSAINNVIQRMKSDGTLKRLEDKWLSGDRSQRKPEDVKLVAKKGTWRIGMEAQSPPLNYLQDGQMIGLEVDILRLCAAELGYDIKILNFEYATLINALVTNKVDIVASMMVKTKERAASALFSESYYKNKVIAVVLDETVSPESNISAAIKETPLSEFKGKKIAGLTGTVYADAIKDKLDVALIEYNSNADRLQALNEGKVDGIIDEEPSVRYMIAYNDGEFTQASGKFTSDNYAGAVRLDDKELGDKIDLIIKRFKADGTLEKLDKKWFENVKEDKSIDIQLDAQNGVLKIATMAQIPPFTYVSNNKVVGYDIELMYLVAKELGMGIEVTDMNFAGLIPSLISKKVDVIISCITVTPERAQSIRLLEPNYQGGLVIMAKNQSAVNSTSTSFMDELKDNWQKNFIKEDRYKLILQGLWTTIVITVGSAILGTILALAVCLMRRSSNKLLSIPAIMYIRLVQGTPIVVLLLILYYVVFAKLDISENLVAIIAFAINFSAYVSEMMRTGVDTVDKGQVEAGQALGFGVVAIYRKIIFPQALRHVLPVYKGEFISMLKMTSIVGYIAIQDLTKMSDIIRSRTYDAFFPLIATAIIYFVVAYVFIYFLNRIEASFDPKRRNRALDHF